jgi:hypothetical protein
MMIESSLDLRKCKSFRSLPMEIFVPSILSYEPRIYSIRALQKNAAICQGEMTRVHGHE